MGPTEGIRSEFPLLKLPNELLLEVGSHLDSFQDLNSLVRSSSVFHKMFNTHLFRRAVAADDAVLDDIVRWVLSRYRLASLTLLLDHGLSVNRTLKSGGDVFRETMLHSLCNLDDPQRAVPLARLLIQRGADIQAADGLGCSVLIRAIIRRNCPIITLLLAHGADPNAANKWGRTPLWIASRKEEPWIAYLLIAHGATIDARCNGETPLLAAIRTWSHAVILLLLAHGADAGVQNTHGETVLHLAIRGSRGQSHEVAKLLLEHGAAVNAIDRRGQTPLHWASGVPRDESLLMVKFLLENGADINAISNRGLSPLRCAAHWRNHGVAKLLLAHGADVSVLAPWERELLELPAEN
jgi:ankyrin repeat protein